MPRSWPDEYIVKAFDAIIAIELARGGTPNGTAACRAPPIAGDDAAAKELVTGLHDTFGFDVVDAGSFSEGWRFEEGSRPTGCPLR